MAKPIGKSKTENMQAGLAAARAQLSDLLPPLIGQAAASYQAFAVIEPPDDAKGFAAHHAACRAALSHLDLLSRLARWASGPEGDSDTDDATRLLAAARAALGDLGEDDDL